MPHATLPPSPGLQALILCGPGLSLTPFTSNSLTLPKALLPIANRPMLWYPLTWCHWAGITDITLITPSEAAPALEAALATNPALTGLPRPAPTVLAPKGLKLESGTAECLRMEEVRRIVRGGFVVLPCDLVAEVEGSEILGLWMGMNPLAGDVLSSGASSSGQRGQSKRTSGGNQKAGGLCVFYPTPSASPSNDPSAKKQNQRDETDFLATAPLPSTLRNPAILGSLEQVVLAMPTDTLKDTLDDSHNLFRLRPRLLTAHPRVRMRMRWRDAHIYVFPRWVLDFVARNKGWESLGEDVVGWWAKARWQGQSLSEKLGLEDVLGEGDEDREEVDRDGEGEMEEMVDALALSSTWAAPAPIPATGRVQRTPTLASRVSSTTPQSAQNNNDDRNISPPRVPPLLAYIQPASSPDTSPSPIIQRCDTPAHLANISLELARQSFMPTHPWSFSYKIDPTATIGQQARISSDDTLIGANSLIGARCNIKESVIGANCSLGSNVRVVRCLLMDGVMVGDGCQLTGCVVGVRARLGEGARLTDCLVAPGFGVEGGVDAKGETLVGFDTEGGEEEDEGDEEEEEE